MKIKDLLVELEGKDSYKDFVKEHPENYFCAGFFILGDDGDKVQLDFFLPKLNKISSFEYPFNSFKVHDDEIKNILEIKDLEPKINLCDLKGFVKEKTKKSFSKVIAILKDNLWNITCLSGLDMQRIKVNAYTGDVQEEGKDNLMNFMGVRKGGRK